MICQALRISIFNSFHSVTRITYNVHKILQGVPKKWARSDPKWPRPSERTWMAQSGPKWPKIPASHHSPQNFKSTFFLGHPVYTRISKHESGFFDNEPTIDALLEQLRMELALFCVKIGRTRDLL